jgi:hypothetical protein
LLLSVLWGLTVLIAMGAFGALVIRLVLGRPDSLALVGLSVPVGGGLLTWMIFVLGWAGMPFTQLTCALVWFVSMALVLMLIRRGRPRLPQPMGASEEVAGPAERLSAVVIWVLFAGAIGLAVFVSIGRAYGSWDAAAGWAIKGYGIAKDGTIFAAQSWGAWGLAYPLNLSLQIGFFQLYGQDLLPVSKALFPLFLASLGVGCYRYWRVQGVAWYLRDPALLFIASVPLIFLHATWGYANLPLAAYLVQAVAWAIVGLSSRDPRSTLLGGLLFGLSAWTRPEAVVYCLAGLLAVLASMWLAGKRGLPWLWLVTPLAVMAGVWTAFGWGSVNSNRLGGGAMRATLSAILAGDWHLRQLYLVPRLLADRAMKNTDWGTLFEAAGVLVLLRLHTLRPRLRPQVFAAFVATAMISAASVGLFYSQSFILPNTFVTVLNRSFDRAFFPAASLMVLTAVSLFADGLTKTGPSVAAQQPVPGNLPAQA